MARLESKIIRLKAKDKQRVSHRINHLIIITSNNFQ
jgi:hypothetical protein